MGALYNTKNIKCMKKNFWLKFKGVGKVKISPPDTNRLNSTTRYLYAQQKNKNY